jgi:hypothetical protein
MGKNSKAHMKVLNSKEVQGVFGDMLGMGQGDPALCHVKLTRVRDQFTRIVKVLEALARVSGVAEFAPGVSAALAEYAERLAEMGAACLIVPVEREDLGDTPVSFPDIAEAYPFADPSEALMYGDAVPYDIDSCPRPVLEAWFVEYKKALGSPAVEAATRLVGNLEEFKAYLDPEGVHSGTPAETNYLFAPFDAQAGAPEALAGFDFRGLAEIPEFAADAGSKQITHLIFRKLYAVLAEFNAVYYMPDIDPEQLSQVIMGSLELLKKDVTGCDDAFKALSRSAGLFHTNFPKYYKELTNTGSTFSVLELFIREISGEMTGKVATQFGRLVGHIQSKANKATANDAIGSALLNVAEVALGSTGVDTSYDADASPASASSSEPAAAPAPAAAAEPAETLPPTYSEVIANPDDDEFLPRHLRKPAKKTKKQNKKKNKKKK